MQTADAFDHTNGRVNSTNEPPTKKLKFYGGSNHALFKMMCGFGCMIEGNVFPSSVTSDKKCIERSLPLLPRLERVSKRCSSQIRYLGPELISSRMACILVLGNESFKFHMASQSSHRSLCVKQYLFCVVVIIFSLHNCKFVAY